MMKRVVLAALAAMALTAGVASSAQAAPYWECPKSVAATCQVVGESNDTEMNLPGFGGVFKCTGTSTAPGLRLSGFMPGSKTYGSSYTDSLTLAPVYTGCKFLGVSNKVETQGCAYKFRLTTGERDPWAITTDIVCPEGKAITISNPALDCVTTIGSQTGLQGIVTTKVSGGQELTFGLEGITHTSTGPNCGIQGTSSKGRFAGTVLLRAKEFGGEYKYRPLSVMPY